MRNVILSVIALLSVSAGVAQAQGLAGTWQGTLEAGQPLRVVITVTRSDSGALNGVFRSIDQSPQGVSVSALTLEGAAVKFAIPALNATYEGRLSTDAGSITGTFTQGARSVALSLARANPETAWTMPSPPAALRPMPANAVPTFEVATIKPSNPNQQGKGFTVRGREVITINTSVRDLVAFAYSVHPRQIVRGPGWLETEKFDITGQPDIEGLPNQLQMRTLVQKLLTDRFKLTFHREKQELSIYALVVGPKGPALTKSSGDPDGLPSLLFRGLGSLPAINASMTDFATVMQAAVLDRPVVDRTGLAGRYDFSLTWTPDETQFASMGVKVPPPPADATAPSLFTAIQEQLGLKFEPSRSPVDVMVIDSLEHPSPN
ncbi:MAG TPA: TIGR03435 family protein [Vicinamibacterales bacterium]